MANLSSDLQASIEALGTQHTNLIQAVRNYKDGSVAGAANDLLEAKEKTVADIESKESYLLGLITKYSPNPMPSLLADFKNNIFLKRKGGSVRGVSGEDAYVFSRAGSAFYWDSDGVLKEAGVDELRPAYDPESGESQGVLIETSATNLLQWSQTTSEWAAENHIVDRTGNYDMWGIPAWTIEGVSNGSITAPRHSVAVTSGKIYTATHLIRYVSGDGWVRIRFGLSSGSLSVLVNVKTGETGSAQMTHTVKKVGVAYLITTTSPDIGFNGNSFVSITPWSTNLTSEGEPAGKIIHYFSQVEEGESGTSYVKTLGSIATRPADIFYVPLDGSINPFSDFSFYAELEIHALDTFGAFFGIGQLNPNSGTFWNYRGIGFSRDNPNNPSIYTNAQIPDYRSYSTQGFEYARIKVSMRYERSTGQARGCVNGVLVEPMDLSEHTFSQYLEALFPFSGGAFRGNGGLAAGGVIEMGTYSFALNDVQLQELTV